MKSEGRFFFLFLILLVCLVLFVKQGGITGNIPLTGILKEASDDPVNLQEFEINYNFMSDEVYKLRDVAFTLDFKPKFSRSSLVKLDYVIVDSSGDLIYFDSEEITIKDEMTVKRVLDNRKTHDLEIPEGDYGFSVVVSYGDNEEKFSTKFKKKRISDFLYSLKQLFDINVKIDNDRLDDSNKLMAMVTFESFGEEDTPANLTFFIYDSKDRELYRKEMNTVVQTEQMMFVNFFDLNLKPGEYTLVTRSLYNVGVEDYYENKFVVLDKVKLWPFFLLGGILLLGLYLLIKRK